MCFARWAAPVCLCQATYLMLWGFDGIEFNKAGQESVRAKARPLRSDRGRSAMMHSDSFSETQHSPRTRDILHTGHPAHRANKRTNGGPSWHSRRHIPYATPCAFHECNVGMDFHGRSCCCVPGAGTHMCASPYYCQCRHTHACQPVSACGMVRENGSSAVRSAHGAHWTDHGEPQTEDSFLSLGTRTAPASCSSTAPRTGDMGQWTCPASSLWAWATLTTRWHRPCPSGSSWPSSGTRPACPAKCL